MTAADAGLNEVAGPKVLVTEESSVALAPVVVLGVELDEQAVSVAASTTHVAASRRKRFPPDVMRGNATGQRCRLPVVVAAAPPSWPATAATGRRTRSAG